MRSREVPLQNHHLPPAWLTRSFSHQLTPFPSSDKPCELYCSPLGKDSPLLVADRVLDGTPCGPYETDLCVHGRCQVTRFPCVLAGASGRRLPLAGGAWSRAGASGGLGGWAFFKKVPGALPPASRQPALPQQCPSVRLTSRSVRSLGCLNESWQHNNLKNV